MKHSQKGFGVVEIILVAVVVLLIGALVYVFIARPFGTKEATTQETSSKQVAETPTNKDETPAEEPAQTTEDKAVSLATKAYNEYRTAFIASPGSAYAEHLVPYMSDSLIQRFGDGAVGYNPFFCSHDVPKSFEFTAQSTDGSVVTMEITGVIAVRVVSSIKVSVDTASNKITDISCINIQ